MNQGLSDFVKNKLKAKAERRNNQYSTYAAKDFEAIRRKPSGSQSVYRTPYIVDTDRIIHNLFYNRYVDKTQVFSLFKNDDTTRRDSIFNMLCQPPWAGFVFKFDLEAIARARHRHTLFGHKGENF